MGEEMQEWNVDKIQRGGWEYALPWLEPYLIWVLADVTLE